MFLPSERCSNQHLNIYFEICFHESQNACGNKKLSLRAVILNSDKEF